MRPHMSTTHLVRSLGLVTVVKRFSTEPTAIQHLTLTTIESHSEQPVGLEGCPNWVILPSTTNCNLNGYTCHSLIGLLCPRPLKALIGDGSTVFGTAFLGNHVFSP